MRVELKGFSGTWQDVKDAAMTTVGKETGKEPDSSWKKRMLLAEHSPIRLLRFNLKWYDLLYWVSNHFVRHWLGIIHFVKSQRTDRTGINRNELRQNEPVEHMIDVNAQALINISRRRLCSKASIETQEAWIKALTALIPTEPEIVSTCVPECIYRGFCPEFNSCGYSKTSLYECSLKKYRDVKK